MKTSAEILNELIERYPALAPLRGDILTAHSIFTDCFNSSGKILICGNGGSAADSEHIVGELMKGFLSPRKLSHREAALFDNIPNGEYLASKLQGAVPAISLTGQAALTSALGNDVAADMIYAQQVWGYAKNSPDVLLALSTSGNSANVVNAVKTAKALGRKTVGITGSAESELSKLCTVCIRVPETETFKVQELTLPVYHSLCAMLEADIF